MPTRPIYLFMKIALSILSLSLICSAAFAGKYDSKIPRKPISLEEARALLPELEELYETFGKPTLDATKQREEGEARLAAEREQVVKTGRAAIDACKRDEACVIKENDKLFKASDAQAKKTEIAVAQFSDNIQKATIVERAKKSDLTRVALGAGNAVVAQALQHYLETKSDSDDFVLETNIKFTQAIDRKTATDYLNKNVQDRSAIDSSWSVDENDVMGFLSFYFRTKSKQAHVILALPQQSEFKGLATLLQQSDAQTNDSILGINLKIALEELSDKRSGTFFGDIDCLGHTVSKSNWCVGIVKLESQKIVK